MSSGNPATPAGLHHQRFHGWRRGQCGLRGREFRGWGGRWRSLDRAGGGSLPVRPSSGRFARWARGFETKFAAAVGALQCDAPLGSQSKRLLAAGAANVHRFRHGGHVNHHAADRSAAGSSCDPRGTVARLSESCPPGEHDSESRATVTRQNRHFRKIHANRQSLPPPPSDTCCGGGLVPGGIEPLGGLSRHDSSRSTIHQRGALSATSQLAGSQND